MRSISLAPTAPPRAPFRRLPLRNLGSRALRVPVLMLLLSPLLLTACGERPPVRGSVSGRVTFEGEAPKPEDLDLSSAPICASLHEGPVPDRKIRVGPEGGLADAFVVVENPPAGAVPPAPEEPVVLRQRGCLFEPRVLGVRVDQPLVVRNEDPTYHNVVAEPEVNPGFDLSQPFEGMESRMVFEQPELMIPVRSEAQPWMKAWLCVVDHPWFAVTGEDGGFVLEDLPAGDYTLEVRHEVLGRRQVSVTVPPGGTAEVTVAFKEDA
jgi:hypothetical protein